MSIPRRKNTTKSSENMTNHLFMDLNTFDGMKRALIFLCLLAILPMACHKDDMLMKELDLRPHGLQITIMAPDSAVIQEKDYNFMRDITVRKGDRFFLQIFEFAAPRQDAAGEKLRQLTAAREDPYFREVVMEEDQGFIFSKQADSTTVDYDFRYVKILGEKELIFQAGLVGTFSLPDIQRMYTAVKNEE